MMDFEADDGTGLDDASLIQPSGNPAPPAVARSAASQVLTANAQGVVVLPEGVSLDDIQIEGRNIVIIGADGTRYVIVDGTVVVPQLVLDGVAVPPANLAALLLGNEPEPAAGNPQSSGGNFAAAVGDIQAAFDLGSLLPYTQLQFPADEEREIIPDVVDRDPDISIEVDDSGVSVINAQDAVNEAGLPARNGEPAGSNSAANSESTYGFINFTSPDGASEVTLNGVAITQAGQTFTTPLGVLTITSIADGRIGYGYTLTDNTTDPASMDNFAVTITDSDGDMATATLRIDIVDDVPTARNDTDSVPATTFTGQIGNVVTGVGTTSGASGADTPGADGATVTGIHAGTAGTFAAPGTVNGQYGTLSINAQGNYTYTRSANTPGGVTDVFTYRVTDGDGDVSTATLTISIGDAPVTIISVPTTGAGTVVDEAGLPARPNETAGSNEAADVETTAGTITFSAPDGVASVSINGTAVTGAGQTIDTPQGTLTVVTYDPGAGTLGYSFTLDDNTSGDATHVDLSVTVTDLDGDSDTEPFVITIVDDEPTARADSDSVSEDGPTVADGNVITGSGGSDANASDGVADTRGADGASVTAMAFGATAGTVGTPLAGAYGSLTLGADGTYVYTLNNGHPLIQGLDGNDALTETFSYTLTDGDGDTSPTTLTITINGADDVVVINGLDGRGAEETVDEDDLADGSSPDAAALTQGGTFTIDSPDGLATLTVDGISVFGPGVVYPVTFSTSHGTMSITGVATTVDASGDVSAATVSYEYTLTDNTVLHIGGNEGSLTENFAVVATDTDGSSDTASLEVTILDDVPSASADTDGVSEGALLTSAGSVLDNDAGGADGIGAIAGVRAAGTPADTASDVSGGVGSPIAGLYGTLTLAADGSYTYQSDADAITGAEQDVFVYTIVDGDGDLSTTTLTIELADVTLAAVDQTRQADEAALDQIDDDRPGTLDDDLAAGSVDGSDPGSDAETVSGQLTVAGTGVTYTLVGGTSTYGQLQLNADGSYTYTLTDPVDGDSLVPGQGGDNGANTYLAIETFTYEAEDANGNTVQGTITIDILDDVPSAVTTQNAVLGQVGGPDPTSGTFDLDTAAVANDLSDNFGADGGTFRFSNTQTYPDLTSGGEPIVYAVSPDGLTLTGSVTAGTVFTVTLDPTAGTPSYSVNMVRTVDVTAQIDFNAGGYNFTGGNKVWNGFVPTGETLGTLALDNDSSDLLLTPAINGLPDSTVNTTATIGGIGGGASVGSTETFRVDFVTDLRGDPADTGGGDYDTLSKRDHVYDGHYTVNGATALFKSTAGSTIKITASKDSDDSDAITPGVQLENVVGDGVIQTITKIQISYLGVSSALLTPLLDDPSLPGAADPQSVTVNGHVFTYRLLADGSVEVGGVAGEGGASLNGTNIAVYTANGYNSIAYTHTGGDEFQIGDFGASVTVPQPISFALPIEIVDGDGDVAASYVDINLEAWSLVAGVPTSVTQDQSAAGSGQVMVATAAQPHLIGSDFDDTMTGNTGSNVLIGGRGADTMTGLAGSDLFVIDPSHIISASDDVITDYAAGDTIDLRGLFSSMGSQSPTNATEAAATIRLLGNVLQVDSNGTGAGTTWVAVATLTNSPASITVLYQFDQPAISVNSTPPLAIDLDGDGVEFLSAAAGVTFDYTGDGTPEATAWVDGDDGLLAIDLDGDGAVTSGAEIVFGGDGQTDLEGLAARYDDNHDGVLDAQDLEFARFGVWQDANSNGVSEAGEFRSLSELGITSVGLESDGNSYFAANGDVLVQGEATVIRNGASYALADAAFATATIDRRTAEVVVATAAAGALLAPELAAANDLGGNADEPVASMTFDLESAATEAGSDSSSGNASPTTAALLLDGGAPPSDDVASAARHLDDPVMPDTFATTQDEDNDATPVGSSSEAVADFAGPSVGLFEFDGGEALMDAILVGASPETSALQTHDFASLQDALAQVADEAAVDAIVSRYTDAGAGIASSTPGETSSQVLIEALDTHLVFAGMGVQAPDPIDDAAELAAAQA